MAWTVGMLIKAFLYRRTDQKVTDKLLLKVKKDIKFCEELEQKLTSVFFKFVLPELLTQKNDPNNEKPEQLYCKCRRKFLANDCMRRQQLKNWMKTLK
eukprot:gene19729-21675_t